jgi:hypothetical protein
LKIKYLLLICLLAASLGTMLFAAGCQDAAELGAIACEELDGKDRDHCIQQLAVSSGNQAMCNDIESAGPKSKCWIYIASNEKMWKTCFGMKDEAWYGEQGAYDVQECLQYVAKTTMDPYLCLQIEEDYIDQFGSDLNPGGVSRDICESSIQCGKKGQKACYSYADTNYYCISAANNEIWFTNSPITCT